MDSAKKGINLDLDTEALKRHYTKGDWHKAYYEVRNHFEKNGFEHIQGSGYHSLMPMSEAKLLCQRLYHIRCSGNILYCPCLCQGGRAVGLYGDGCGAGY